MGYGWPMRTPTKFLYGFLTLLLMAGSLFVGRSLNSSVPSSPRGTIVLGAASTEFFFGNAKYGLNCELYTANAPASSYTTVAYCQSVQPGQSASLGATGKATFCKGTGCIGNPGLDTPTFPLNTKVILGNATCVLSAEQVRCDRGAHGFVLAVPTVRDRHW